MNEFKVGDKVKVNIKYINEIPKSMWHLLRREAVVKGIGSTRDGKSYAIIHIHGEKYEHNALSDGLDKI